MATNKPSSENTESPASSPAVPAGLAGAAGDVKGSPKPPVSGEVRGPLVVIRAEPGKPLPNPPHSGTWHRDPVTGDLSLMEPGTAEPTGEQVKARREQHRAETVQAREAAEKARVEIHNQSKE